MLLVWLRLDRRMTPAHMTKDQAVTANEEPLLFR